ncbi:MAG: chemotaxis protein CheW [bacterium]
MSKEEKANFENLEKETEIIAKKDQFVVFKIGQEEYGIYIEKVKEIIKPTKITNVPNTPNYILGVINLRGQIVPVVSMLDKIGVVFSGEKDADKERIITVEINDCLIGLKVDMVTEVLWLNDYQIEDIPEDEEIKKEYLFGVSEIEDRLIMLVDLEKLLFIKKDEKK